MVIFTVGNCAHVAILDWFQKNVAIPNPGATTKSLVRQDSVLPKPGSICSTCAQILARFARLDSTFPKPGPITKNCGALRFSTKTFAVQRNDGSKERRQKGRCTGELFPTCFDGMGGRTKRGIANKGSVLSLVAFTLFAGKLSSAEAAKFLGNGSRA